MWQSKGLFFLNEAMGLLQRSFQQRFGSFQFSRVYQVDGILQRPAEQAKPKFMFRRGIRPFPAR